MTSIGIRATPSEIYYAILIMKDDKCTVESVSNLIIPVSLNFPEKLNFVRKTFKDIILEYLVDRAGIRISETTAQTINVERISFEAILQEVLASSSIEKYMLGQISSLSSKLGFPRENFKKIISGEFQYPIFESSPKWNTNEKESILTALAALNL